MPSQNSKEELQDKYYSKEYIIHEILKGCRDRDFSVLGKNNANVRGLLVRRVIDFRKRLKLINWDKNKQNFYRSVATLKHIPLFTFNPKERSEETQDWYRHHYNEEILHYDLFFDWDKPKEVYWHELIEEVKVFKSFLDEYKVPYYLIFSGSKGFQVIIRGELLPIGKIEGGNIFPHKNIVENIKKKLGLRMLDLSNNGVNSRLCKIPYSIVGENIALPLTDEQFNNFNLDDMKIENVLKNVKIHMRGCLERFNEIDIEQKKKNLREFINIFNFKEEVKNESPLLRTGF